MVTYGGGHVNMMIPIVRYLEDYPEYHVEVLALTTAGPVLKQEGIPYYGMRHFIEDQDSTALEWGKRLAQEMPPGKVPQEETIAYMGLSYMDLIQRYGENEAEQMYAELGRQAFCPVNVLERILKQMEPDLVIATNSPRAEKAAILAARNLNIPALCLIDLFGLWEVEWIGQPGYADKICVLSDYVKQVVVSAGRKLSEVVVTGNPAFDPLADPRLSTKGRELRKQRGWGSDLVILWCSQTEPKAHPLTGKVGDPELPRKIDRQLFDILTRHPRWRLVIRPHPNENAQFDQLPERVELSTTEDDLEILLEAVDSIVTMTSTVGLQGAMLGKPFCSIQMSVYSPDAPYADMGIAWGVNRLEELEEGLVQCLEKNWRPAAKLTNDGKATERISQVIRSMI